MEGHLCIYYASCASALADPTCRALKNYRPVIFTKRESASLSRSISDEFDFTSSLLFVFVSRESKVSKIAVDCDTVSFSLPLAFHFCRLEKVVLEKEGWILEKNLRI